MEELVIKAKNGDKEALEKLVNSIYDKLEKFAEIRMKSETDAQDIVQNTMEKICKNINQLKEPKYFETWAIRILINECNKKYNEKTNKNENIEEYKNIISNSKTEEINSKIDIINILQLLDEEDKSIMILYYNEYKIKEIAEIMQMNENTVKTRIKRAKEKIKNNYTIDKKKGQIIKIRKTLIIILVLIIATTGLVYGKDIVQFVKNIFVKNQTDGVQTAIDNGYIEDQKTQTIETDNFKIAVESFLIDDYNFDITFNIKIKEEDINRVDLEKIVITDENENIIFNTTNMATQVPKGQYYKGSYTKYSEQISKDTFKLYLKCSNEFQKPQKLTVKFGSIIFFTNSKEIVNNYDGNWKFELDIPEKMYNSEAIIYKVKSCSDKNMKIEDAILTNTAFKISIPETTTDKIDYELLQIKPPKKISDLIALSNEYVETSDGKIFDTSTRDGDSGHTAPLRRK